MKECLDPGQKIVLFKWDWLNGRFVEHRNKLLCLGCRMTERFDQFRARFDDRLQIIGEEFQEDSRGGSREGENIVRIVSPEIEAIVTTEPSNPTK